MAFQVLSIEQKDNPTLLEVVISDGYCDYNFNVEVEIFRIAGHQVQNISAEEGLFRFFQYHPMMVNHVHQLVAKVYNGQKVEFPWLLPNLLA